MPYLWLDGTAVVLLSSEMARWASCCADGAGPSRGTEDHMGIGRGIVTRAGYIGIGVGIGLAFTIHGANAAPPTPDLAHQSTCMIAVNGTSYVVRITGSTAAAACTRELNASKKGLFIGHLYVGTLKGRVLVCQGVEKDGNLHQIFSKSTSDGLARLGCAALRADLRR